MSIFNVSNQKFYLDSYRSPLSIDQLADEISSNPTSLENFKNYGIENEENRFKIIKKVLDNFPSEKLRASVLKHFQLFDLHEEHRLEIAKLLAEQFSYLALQYFPNFDLTKDDHKMDFLTVILKSNALHFLPQYFHHLNLQIESNRLTIAMAFAKRVPTSTLNHFRNLGLTEDKSRVAVLKVIFEDPYVDDVVDWVAHFNNLGLEEDDNRLEIAKLILSRGILFERILCVPSLGLIEEHNKIELAKFIIELPKGAQEVAKSFNLFKFQKENSKVQVAHLLFKKVPKQLVELFEKVDLQEEGHRLEFTQLCYEKNPDLTINNFYKFALQEESNKQIFARDYVQKNPTNAIKKFDKFGLKEENCKMELTLALIEKDADLVIHHFEKLELQEESNRLQISKILFEKNFFLANYDHDGENNFNKFALHEEINRVALVDHLLEKNPLDVAMHFATFRIEQKSNREKFAQLITEKNLFKLSPFFNGLFKEVLMLTNINHFKERSSWIRTNDRAYKDLVLKHRNENKELQGLMKSIYSLPRPQQREKVAKKLVEHLQTSKAWKELDQFYEVQSKILPSTPKNQLVPYFLADKIFSSSENPDEIMKQWNDELIASDSLFSDGKHMSLLINFLLNLENLQQKEVAINQIFFPSLSKMKKTREGLRLNRKEKLEKEKEEREVRDTYPQRLRLTNTLLSFGKGAISELNTPLDLEILKKLCTHYFIEKIQLEEIDVVDIANAYDQQIAALGEEIETGIFTYLEKIHQLPEKELIQVKKHYQNLILSVLNNTYASWRYETSPQIQFFKKQGHHELLEKWQEQKAPLPLENFLGEGKGKKTFSDEFYDFLQTRLIVDKHIVDLSNRLPTIYKYLTKEFSLEKALIEGHGLEKLILKLCEPNASSKQLKELMNHLQKKEFKEGFDLWKTDLAEFISAQSAQSSPLKGYTLMRTHKFSDILLIGKHTGGCQSIEAEPDYNKAAMGYFDGQIEALQVNNPEGIAVARHILRLDKNVRTHEPVLFLERYYTVNSHPALKDGLMQFAIYQAKELNLLLLTKEVIDPKEKYEKYPDDIESIGSNAPYMYSDAYVGMSQDGFKIRESYRLFTPK